MRKVYVLVEEFHEGQFHEGRRIVSVFAERKNADRARHDLLPTSRDSIGYKVETYEVIESENQTGGE